MKKGDFFILIVAVKMIYNLCQEKKMIISALPYTFV